MVEWVDTPGGSKAHVGPGLTLEVMAGAFYDWYAFAFSPIGGIGPFPCMPSAKLAAEAEARRALMQGLRELGWPDDAAVERACDCWNKATSTFMPDDADYVAEMRSDMRAALTAAMEASDGRRPKRT